MRGGKSGTSRTTAKMNEWNVNLDKYVMKWWLQKVVIDLKDLSAWDALRADLQLYAVKHYFKLIQNDYMR